jgi:hypothetical protein
LANLTPFSLQPYPYVHMLSVITDVALVVNAVAVGTGLGRIIAVYNCSSMLHACIRFTNIFSASISEAKMKLLILYKRTPY